jgi:hypothetical protein
MHYLPIGRHRGEPLPHVSTDYLVWYLENCDPSTGLRHAIYAELAGRPDAPCLPPEPLMDPPPACDRCGFGPGLIYRWQTTRAGTKQIRRECRRCGRFCGFAPQIEPFLSAAQG